MASSQQFSLRWNNYLTHITEAFDNLRSDEDLVDVTLSCEGKRIRAHKMLLSACSTYFRDLFKENPCQHPVIIFRNVKFEDLVALIDFMYQGEVNVVQEQLSSFLTTAELLAVQGLSEGSGKDSNPDSRELELPDSPTLPPEPEVQMSNSSQNISQQLPGTSNSDVASPSFYPTEKRSESPPTAKRRKWSSSTSGTKPSGNGNGKKDERESETERRRGSNQASSVSNVDPVEIIPEVVNVPNVKEEMLEYMEQDQDASSCSYSDSNQGAISGNSVQNSGRDNIPTLTQGLSSGLIHTETKQEPPDMYSSNSRESSLPPSAEGLTAADLSQILAKPGPSSENQSQDSLQGEEYPKVGSYMLAGDRYMCSLCLHTFNSLPILTRHVAAKHQKQEYIFACLKCNRYFKTKWSLSTHNSRYHKTFPFNEPPQPSQQTDNANNA